MEQSIRSIQSMESIQSSQQNLSIRSIPTNLPTKHLFCEGPSNAQIAIITQAPSRSDVSNDRLLTGPTGKLFRGLANEAGLDIEQCLVTSISKVRPEDDLWENIQAPKSVLRAETISELSQYPNLRLLIPCGEPALNILCSRKGITQWRGSIFKLPDLLPNSSDLRCIPIQNPAAKFHQERLKRAGAQQSKKGKVLSQVIVTDLKKCVSEIRDWKPLPEEEYRFIYPKSVDEIISWMKANEGRITSVDTETYQRPLRISCMSLAINDREALSLQFEIGGGKSRWTSSEEAEIILRLDKYLKNSPLIMQNCLYDLVVFHWLGIRVPPKNMWLDTMLAHHACFAELPHGLDFLDSIYTRQYYYKAEGKSWHPTFSMEQLFRYNCLDSVTTYECAMEISEELNEMGLVQIYEEKYHNKIPALLDASLRGIPQSLEAKRIIVKQHRLIGDRLQGELNQLAGWEVNVNSPKHMQKLLYEQLALPVVLNKSGNPTADDKTIRKLAYQHQKPEIRKILSVRQMKKIISTYVDIPADSDGKIRCQFNMMGTTSGRLSETNSATGSGSTLHNLPRGSIEIVLYGKKIKLKSIKSMFAFPPPYILVLPDYKQAEVYVVAFLAGENRLMDILLSGKDIHRQVASLIFKVPIDKVSSDQRYLAKRTVHAANYGMGPFRFAEILTKEDVFLQPRETQKLLQSYHLQFPRIQSVYHASIAKEAQDTRQLISPTGRKKLIFDELNDHTFKSAYSFKPQAVVSDLLNDAIVKVAERMPVLGQQHDSLWALSTIRNIERDILFIHSCMDVPVRISGHDIHIPIDFKYGPSLGDLYDHKDGANINYEWIEQNRILKEGKLNPKVGWFEYEEFFSETNI